MLKPTWMAGDTARLKNVMDEFYRKVCTDALSMKAIVDLDETTYFAFLCLSCGNPHRMLKLDRDRMSVLIRNKIPPHDHPEYAEHCELEQDFVARTRTLNNLEYARTHVAEREKVRVKDAEELQDVVFNKLLSSFCQSFNRIYGKNCGEHLIEYYCSKHEEKHYLTLPVFEKFRAQMTSQFPPNFVQKNLSAETKLVIAAWLVERRKRFETEHPVFIVKVQPELRPKKAKKKKKKTSCKSHVVTPSVALHRSRPVKAEPTLQGADMSLTLQLTPNDKNDYVLHPGLMSDEWLIEYQVCGRKVAFSQLEEAQHQAEICKKDTYKCSYCDNWHIGKKNPGITRMSEVAQRGLKWYLRDARKANRFIYKIMMEG